jgi:hypothetical protein
MFAEMPTEHRILAFNKNELFEALKDYCANTRRPLRADAANGLILHQDSEVKITLNLPGNEPTINFTENEVGAALVMLCIKKRIPIAKRAVKSLEVANETLSLHLKIGP